MTLLHTSLLINLRGTYSVQIFKKMYLRSYNNLSGRLVIIKLKKVQDSHQTPQLQILYETYFLCISFLTTLYYSSKNLFDQDNTYIVQFVNGHIGITITGKAILHMQFLHVHESCPRKVA